MEDSSTVHQPLLDRRERDEKTPIPDDVPIAPRRPTARSAKVPRYFIAILAVLPGLLMLFAGHIRHRLKEIRVPDCECTDAKAVVAPRSNIWKNLNVSEATAVRQWLFAEERGLNLTQIDLAEESDNHIHYVEISKPPKSAMLTYLNDSSHEVPRYAHAVINFGTEEEIKDFRIGPLPISSKTRMEETPYHHRIPLNGKIPHNWHALSVFMERTLTPVDPAMRGLLNASFFDGTLSAGGGGPMSYDGSFRRAWMTAKFNRPGFWLLSTGLFFQVDFTGTDSNLWEIRKVVYGHEIFDSLKDFHKAWEKGFLKPMQIPEPDDLDWSSRKLRGEQRDLDDRAPPRRVMFDGARYRVDAEQDYVTWMGWSFYMSFERDMGLHLWDINFRGERIIYELSPQEAMATYSGTDPVQGSTTWLDRAFGMGNLVRELILGYDCPADALLLNATVHDSGSSMRRNAICVFESDKHIPLSRHFEQTKNTMGAVKGNELVVRTISTVGNYDYIFDYTFQLDGSIEIRVSASGYLQGGFWREDQAPYGHPIHPAFMGSLHDHVMNFKVDFDIAGTRNSLLAAKLETEEKEVEWLDPFWGEVLQQRINREILPIETSLNYFPNSEGTYVVVNQEEHNAWGSPRGYMIHPGTVCHLTNLENKRTEHNVHWAKTHLSVTKRKEEEQSSSSSWNINLPGAPPVDFERFLDGDSIEQEDLVVWLNLGTHHIPRSEDAPNTLTNIATSYVMLTPWNYNDYDVSIESRSSVRMNQRPDVTFEIEEGNLAPRCMPKTYGKVQYHGTDVWSEAGEPLDRLGKIYQQLYGQANHALRLFHRTSESEL